MDSMIILVVLAYIIDACGYTATKAALFYASPIMCMVLRMVGAGGVLCAYVYWFDPDQWRLFQGTRWRYRWILAQIVFIYIYLTYITYFMSMRLLPSSKVALLYNLSPFVTALLGYFLLDQHMTLRKWVGLSIGFFGMLPLVMGNDQAQLTYISWGELLALISVVAASYGWFVVYKLIHVDYSPVLINGIGMLGGGLLALPTSWIVEGGIQERWPFFQQLFIMSAGQSFPDGVWLLWYTALAIVAVNIVFYNFNSLLLKYYSIVFLSFVGMITPIIVAFLGWAFLDEALPAHFISSFMLFSLGLLIFYREELAQIDLIRNS